MTVDAAVRTLDRLGLRGLGRAAKRLVPDVPVTRTVNHLGRLSFGLRRHRWLLGPRCLDGHAATLALFARQIDRGDVLWDVGANIGYYARFCLAHLGPSRVVCLEPLPANLARLRRNARLFDDPARMTVLPYALAERDGRERMEREGHTGGSAFLSRLHDSHGGGDTIETRRFDALLAGGDLPPPAVVKIDTEGAEHLVLRGASALLRDRRPRLIVALHPGPGAAEVFSILASHDYYVAGRTPGGWRVVTDPEELSDNNVIAAVDRARVERPVAPLDLSKFPTP